jgi:hypothetical protein
MSDELPLDWAVPTFREIASQPMMFGIHPQHFALVVVFGCLPSLILIFVSAFGHNKASMWLAFAMAAVLIPALLFLFRTLTQADPWWVEGLTSHKFPAERYLGK